MIILESLITWFLTFVAHIKLESFSILGISSKQLISWAIAFIMALLLSHFGFLGLLANSIIIHSVVIGFVSNGIADLINSVKNWYVNLPK